MLLSLLWERKMRGFNKRLAIIICLFFLVPIYVSCEKEDDYEVNNNLSGQNTESIKCVKESLENVFRFVRQNQRQGEIVAIGFGVNEQYFLLVFDDGSSMELIPMVKESGIGYPDITLSRDENGFYWIIQTVSLRSVSVKIKKMSSEEDVPRVMYARGSWWYDSGTKGWVKIRRTERFNMSFDLNSTPEGVKMVSSTGCQVCVGWSNHVETLCTNEPNQSYYKDIFLDAGYGLSNWTKLSSVNLLKLSMDYFSSSIPSDTIIQNEILGGYDDDCNGRLLYPDGQPRYRMLFVVGGSSRTHGKSLRELTRDRMKSFYYAGGSYVGTCAGAAFVSSGYNSTDNYPYYLHIWPYSHISPGVKSSAVGMKIPPNSPLLKYYRFGDDGIVANIRHNKGLYVDRWPANAEILAWNDSTSDSVLRNKPAIWSYKHDNNSGRLVVTGSHPEGYTSGERRELMAAMIRYAIDGCGPSKIKGLLKNGEKWEMNKSTKDNDPNHTKIGDLQYHHFAVYIPQDANNVSFNVTSELDCDLGLYLSKKTIAYDSEAEFESTSEGANPSLEFDRMEPGIWYVSVRCNTTVTVVDEEWGQTYTGRTNVLNGIPYSICVSWE